MKGFIEHLIVSNDKFERELERESYGVEMPCFKEEFVKWLHNKGCSDNTIETYVKRLHTIDNRLYYEFSYDVFLALAQIVRHGEVEKYHVLRNRITEALRHSHITDVQDGMEKEDSSTFTGQVSTLNTYLSFIDGYIISRDIAEEVFHIELSPLFMASEFKEWLSKRQQNIETQNQYVSAINRLRREVFAYLTTVTDDPMSFLSNDIPDKSKLLLKKLQKHVEKECSSPSLLSSTDKNVLKNIKTAFMTYETFIEGTL